MNIGVAMDGLEADPPEIGSQAEKKQPQTLAAKCELHIYRLGLWIFSVQSSNITTFDKPTAKHTSASKEKNMFVFSGFSNLPPSSHHFDSKNARNPGADPGTRSFMFGSGL